jgi:hypothetical protein
MNSPRRLNVASISTNVNGTGSDYAQLGQFEGSTAAAAAHDDDVTSLNRTLRTKVASTWDQASTLMRVIAFGCLIPVFYWMPHWMKWLWIVVCVTLGIYRYRQKAAAIRQEAILQSNLSRIDRERQDSEAMVHQAAQMMLELDKNHLEEFVIQNPSGTYEEWIQELHPDNFHEGILDHRFYVEDSDHRKLWNDSLSGSVREFVPTKSVTTTTTNYSY